MLLVNIIFTGKCNHPVNANIDDDVPKIGSLALNLITASKKINFKTRKIIARCEIATIL